MNRYIKSTRTLNLGQLKQSFKGLIMERVSVAILRYRHDLLGNLGWHLDYRFTWSQYLDYSKTFEGEGVKWKAQII
jgi:hypothetical protein